LITYHYVHKHPIIYSITIYGDVVAVIEW